MRRVLVSSLILAGIGFGAGRWIPAPVRMVYMAVGQGDAAVFSAEGTHVLVDTGPAHGGYEAAQFLVLPKIRDYGVDRVSLVFLTHPDSDHIGGLGTIRRKFPTARLVANRAFRDHPDLRPWREEIQWVTGLTEWRFGSAFIRCYAPPFPTEDNEGSLVLLMGSGTARAVLSGDAPASEEAVAASLSDWSAQVMNAGHHGSRTSTSETWLREVRPKVVVMSAGRDNAYGHPTPETQQRVVRAGARPHRTDRDGDAVFTVRNGRFVRQN